MDLAIWDYPPAEFMVSGFTSGAVENPFRIKRYRPEECAKLLVQGDVDVALLPTSMALQASEAVDVLPSVGLVSWKYPYARLVWKGGLHDFPETVAFERRSVQERFVTRVVLQEHYGIQPTFVPYDVDAPTALMDTDEDAALLTGPGVPSLQPGPFDMDIGREWYELTNYPMVWGVYVTKRDQSNDEMIQALIDSAQAAEENRDVWVQAQETSKALNEFYREDLRTGLDRLAIASLTELRKFLFYFDVTDEVPDVPFVYLDEDDEEGDGSDESAPDVRVEGARTQTPPSQAGGPTEQAPPTLDLSSISTPSSEDLERSDTPDPSEASESEDVETTDEASDSPDAPETPGGSSDTISSPGASSPEDFFQQQRRRYDDAEDGDNGDDDSPEQPDPFGGEG